MDAEAVIGMVSAAQKRCPSATCSFLSAKVRAQKNHTVAFLDTLTDSDLQLAMTRAVSLGQSAVRVGRKNMIELHEELLRRQAEKHLTKQRREMKQTEKKL